MHLCKAEDFDRDDSWSLFFLNAVRISYKIYCIDRDDLAAATIYGKKNDLLDTKSSKDSEKK